MRQPSAVDDLRQQQTGDPLFSDSWDLTFWSPGGEVGGYVRLDLREGANWYWACLCGPGRQLVLVVDDDVPTPRAPGLEIRSPGLWADVIVETPLRHMTVGLEAFGVGLDDPAESYGKAWGDQVPIGFDLEWETAGPALGSAHGVDMACAVHGEILVGAEVLDLDGLGHRRRVSRARDWWSARTWSFWGRLDDGTSFSLDGRDDDGSGLAHLLVPGDAGGWTEATAVASLSEVRGGFHGGARFRLDDVYLAVEPIAWAPVPVIGPHGARAHVARALARFDTGDGRSGHGWFEISDPQ